MIVALFMTLSDFISMITYLMHDDELSIESDNIFAATEARIRLNRTSLSKLEINSDDDHLLQESNSVDRPEDNI